MNPLVVRLEADSRPSTEIIDEFSLGAEMPGLVALVALGAFPATNRGHSVRPMFEILDDDEGGLIWCGWERPCPDCDNFAYATRCKEHPEKTLPTEDGDGTVRILPQEAPGD